MCKRNCKKGGSEGRGGGCVQGPNPRGNQDKSLHWCVITPPFILLNLSFPLVDPLLSYKCKDDLIVVAGALGLKTTGTVSELTAIIKSHLSDNLNLQLDPWFAGLFLQNKRHCVH